MDYAHAAAKEIAECEMRDEGAHGSIEEYVAIIEKHESERVRELEIACKAIVAWMENECPADISGRASASTVYSIARAALGAE